MANRSKLKIGQQEFVVGTFQNNQMLYEFPMVLRFLEYQGKTLFGQNFRLHGADHRLIYKLTNYFIGDTKICEKLGLDLKKGILLIGPAGCGKTALMKLMRYLVPHKPGYAVIPCRNIVFGFSHLGHKIIEDYGNTKSYFFDDLGVEPSGKHFTTECNVMGELLISRYELFTATGIKTHITTNLTATVLENRYGDRVRSRMREMFNLISFQEGTEDERK